MIGPNRPGGLQEGDMTAHGLYSDLGTLIFISSLKKLGNSLSSYHVALACTDVAFGLTAASMQLAAGPPAGERGSQWTQQGWLNQAPCALRSAELVLDLLLRPASMQREVGRAVWWDSKGCMSDISQSQ